MKYSQLFGSPGIIGDASIFDFHLDLNLALGLVKNRLRTTWLITAPAPTPRTTRPRASTRQILRVRPSPPFPWNRHFRRAGRGAASAGIISPLTPRTFIWGARARATRARRRRSRRRWISRRACRRTSTRSRPREVTTSRTSSSRSRFRIS